MAPIWPPATPRRGHGFAGQTGGKAEIVDDELDDAGIAAVVLGSVQHDPRGGGHELLHGVDIGRFTVLARKGQVQFVRVHYIDLHVRLAAQLVLNEGERHRSEVAGAHTAVYGRDADAVVVLGHDLSSLDQLIYTSHHPCARCVGILAVLPQAVSGRSYPPVHVPGIPAVPSAT